MSEFQTLQDIVWAAREKLPREVWDFVTYGTETETTLRRNRQALDSLALLPRVLRDVMEIDVRTSFLGLPLRLPVLLAPIGSISLLDPSGAVAAARASEAFGTVPIISGFADPGFEAVATDCRSPLIYALHPRADNAFMDDLVDRVKGAGYRAIAVVTEGAYYSRRERDLMSGLATKARRARTYASLQRQVREERAQGKVPSMEGLHGAGATWELVARIKSRCGLPIIVKGVMTGADARIATEHGVDAIYVSNHGGRALDHGRGTATALAEVLDAVEGRLEVIVDGGFVRGTDVVKALALGAKAVSIGRLQSWALAAGGEQGLVRCLEILEEELIIAMGLLGVTSTAALNRECVTSATPVDLPHPLSAFPVVMERLRG